MLLEPFLGYELDFFFKIFLFPIVFLPQEETDLS